MRAPRHTARWDRCVQQVKTRSAARSPYAICTAALGAGALLKGHRAPNPLRKGPIELTAVWRDAGHREHTVFQRFATLEAAHRAARRLVIALNRLRSHGVRYHIRKRVPFNP